MDCVKLNIFTNFMRIVTISTAIFLTLLTNGVESNHRSPPSAPSQISNRGVNGFQRQTNSRVLSSQSRAAGSRPGLNRVTGSRTGMARAQISPRLLQNSQQSSLGNTIGRQAVMASRSRMLSQRQRAPSPRTLPRGSNPIARTSTSGSSVRPVTNQQAAQRRASRRTIPPISQIAEILNALQAIIPLAPNDRGTPERPSSGVKLGVDMMSRDEPSRRQNSNVLSSGPSSTRVAPQRQPLAPLATRLQNSPRLINRGRAPVNNQRTPSVTQRDLRSRLGQNVANENRIRAENNFGIESHSMNILNQINNEIFRSQNILSGPEINRESNPQFVRQADNSLSLSNNERGDLISFQPSVFNNQVPHNVQSVSTNQQTGFQSNARNQQPNFAFSRAGVLQQNNAISDQTSMFRVGNNQVVVQPSITANNANNNNNNNDNNNNNNNNVVVDSRNSNVPAMSPSITNQDLSMNTQLQNTNIRQLPQTNMGGLQTTSNQINFASTNTFSDTGTRLGFVADKATFKQSLDVPQSSANSRTNMVPEITQEQPFILSELPTSAPEVQNSRQNMAIQQSPMTNNLNPTNQATGSQGMKDEQFLKNVISVPLPSIPTTTPLPRTTTPKKVVLQIDPSSRGIKIIPDGNGGIKVISLREAPSGSLNGTNSNNSTTGSNSKFSTGTGQPFRRDSGGNGSLRSEIRSNPTADSLKQDIHANITSSQKSSVVHIDPTSTKSFSTIKIITTTPLSLTSTSSITTTSASLSATTIDPELEIEPTPKPTIIHNPATNMNNARARELAGLGPMDRINTTDVPEEIELRNGTSLDGPGPGVPRRVTPNPVENEVTTRRHMNAEEMEEYMADMGISTMENGMMPLFMTTPMPMAEEEATTLPPRKKKTTAVPSKLKSNEPVAEHHTVITKPIVDNKHLVASPMVSEQSNAPNITMDLHVLTQALEALVANAQSIPMQQIAQESGYMQHSENPIVESYQSAPLSNTQENPVDFTFQDFQYVLSEMTKNHHHPNAQISESSVDQQNQLNQNHASTAKEQANDFYYYDQIFSYLNGGRNDAMVPSEVMAERTEIADSIKTPQKMAAPVIQEQGEQLQIRTQGSKNVGNHNPIVVDQNGDGVFSMKNVQYTFTKSAEHNIGEILSNTGLKTSVKNVPRTKRHVARSQGVKTNT